MLHPVTLEYRKKRVTMCFRCHGLGLGWPLDKEKVTLQLNFAVLLWHMHFNYAGSSRRTDGVCI